MNTTIEIVLGRTYTDVVLPEIKGVAVSHCRHMTIGDTVGLECIGRDGKSLVNWVDAVRLVAAGDGRPDIALKD